METIREDNSWEKFYCGEEINGMGAGKGHKVKDSFCLFCFKMVDRKHISVLMLIIRAKEGT